MSACRLAVTVRPTRDAAERQAAFDLRVRVFCGEQGVDAAEELDEFDETAIQLVARDESGVIATCRLRLTALRTMKLERMAVERRLRGQGVGAKLLAAAEDMARAEGATEMLLHAQRRAEGFYAGEGYAAEGGIFLEAGIEHVAMRKAL